MDISEDIFMVSGRLASGHGNPSLPYKERKHLPSLMVGRCFLWIVGL